MCLNLKLKPTVIALLTSSLLLIGLPAQAAQTYRVWVPGLLPVTPTAVWNGSLSLASAVLPDATKGTSYSYDFSSLLSVTGDALNSADISWTPVSALPAGLSLSSTGILSGTPTAISSSTLEISAAHAPTSAQKTYTLDVDGVPLVVTDIEAGGLTSCAIVPGGGVKCWGSNTSGQVGDGTSGNTRITPTNVVGLTSGVTSITLGSSHACALTSAGAVKCWGHNIYGQVGSGSTTPSNVSTPITVFASGIVAVKAGGVHTCVLTSSGGVKCWGNNTWGAVGDGTYTARYSPVDVVGLTSGVSQLFSATGGYYSCVITTSGSAKCWGMNDYRQLGNNNTSDSSVPVDVLGLTSPVLSLAMGYAQTCALTSTNGVKCWGYNNNGQVGDGTTTHRASPVDVVGLTSGVSSIRAGGQQTCALLTNGSTKCWGGNWYSQLGDTTTSNRSSPVTVLGIPTNVTKISASGLNACALLSNNTAKCWGGNEYGQIGRGLQSTSSNAKFVVQ